jgi:pimeloyl-ACP methyl ester carboxylesterase
MPSPSPVHRRPTGLAYRVSGAPSGPTIVLLHGVGNNGGMWDDLAARLSDYRCLAPDLPGHGASRRVPWRSRAESAELIAELIETEATDGRAHVVGLSLGGSVALELLGNRADILDHVVIDGCGVLPSRIIGPMKLGVSAISPFLRFAPVARLIGRAFGVAAGAPVEAFAAQMRAADPASFRRAFADANAIRITPALLASPCPTLLVAGERELGHVRASNRLLAEAMPNGQAFMVPEASHGWGPAQHPDLHRRMVVAWIEDQPLPQELAAEETPVPTPETASATVAPRAR